MISTWWLLLAFSAGGFAGFVLFAMLSLARVARGDEESIAKPRRRATPRVALKQST
jgi:hypothetical protein